MSAAFHIWGILNVTPDSFSDGGRFLHHAQAIEHAVSMIDAGASIIDVGGQSTRPQSQSYGDGALALSPNEELDRVLPVIEALSSRMTSTQRPRNTTLGVTNSADGEEKQVLLSIDTFRPAVASAALEAGCHIVNSTRLPWAPQALGHSHQASVWWPPIAERQELEQIVDVVAKQQAFLVLMHNRGNGTVASPHTDYDNLVLDVRKELEQAAKYAVSRGILREKVFLDPGLGFAKTHKQSLQLLAEIKQLVDTRIPVLLGASRKAFLGAITKRTDGSMPEAASRDPASVAATLFAAQNGVKHFRVHNVEQTRQALQTLTSLQMNMVSREDI